MAQFQCTNYIFWCSGKQLITQVHFSVLHWLMVQKQLHYTALRPCIVISLQRGKSVAPVELYANVPTCCLLSQKIWHLLWYEHTHLSPAANLFVSLPVENLSQQVCFAFKKWHYQHPEKQFKKTEICWLLWMLNSIAIIFPSDQLKPSRRVELEPWWTLDENTVDSRISTTQVWKMYQNNLCWKNRNHHHNPASSLAAKNCC